MLYNLPHLVGLLGSHTGLMLMQGLFFVFLISLLFVLVGWSKEAFARVSKKVKHGRIPAVAKSNNGMHPTGESANAIRQVECLCQCFPAGDAWR